MLRKLPTAVSSPAGMQQARLDGFSLSEDNFMSVRQARNSLSMSGKNRTMNEHSHNLRWARLLRPRFIFSART